MSKYQLKTSIKSYETDALGRVSLANILYYFQEAANLHATSLDWGLEYLDTINKFWVLSRLYIKIDAYPMHKDEIILETWSRGAEGFFAYRDYRVYANEKNCIDATSSWLILDKTTHRPTRPDKIGKEIPGIKESHLPFPGNKITAPEPSKPIFEKKINYSDIDINLHVNNGKYVEIITDSLAGKLLNGSQIKELDIQYMFESQLNDNIAVYCQEEASVLNLSLVNTNKEKETCKCMVKWK